MRAGVAVFQAALLVALASGQEQAPFRVDHSAAHHLCSADRPGCSQLHQAGVLQQIFDRIGRESKFFVEFGARRPQILNSAFFRMREQWRGLLLDGSPDGQCRNCFGVQPESAALLAAEDSSPVRLRKAFLTMENITSDFIKHRVPKTFDLLTIDVDRNDLWLWRGIDPLLFSPRVVAIEFSSFFHGDEDCDVVYKADAVWAGYGTVTNSALRAVNNVMRARNYSFVTQVAGEHAMYVRDDALPESMRGVEIPAVVQEGWQYGVRRRYDAGQHTDYHPELFHCASGPVKRRSSS